MLGHGSMARVSADHPLHAPMLRQFWGNSWRARHNYNKHSMRFRHRATVLLTTLRIYGSRTGNERYLAIEDTRTI